MFRIFLVAFYVFLSIIGIYLPNVLVDNGKWVIFTLISVSLLKELDWFLIKQSCKNSKDKFCKLFKKTSKENDDKQITDEIKELLKNKKKKAFMGIRAMFKRLKDFFVKRYLDLTEKREQEKEAVIQKGADNN